MDMEAYKKARAAIVDHAGVGSRGVKSKIPCDACKTGTLFYEIMPNGHIWAQCNTPGCLAWME